MEESDEKAGDGASTARGTIVPFFRSSLFPTSSDHGILGSLGKIPWTQAMAEFVSDPPIPQEPEEDDSGRPVLLRWVKRPDGRLEMVAIPLTPELFLEP